MEVAQQPSQTLPSLSNGWYKVHEPVVIGLGNLRKANLLGIILRELSLGRVDSVGIRLVDIAASLSCSERTIRRLVNELVATGIITVNRCRFTRANYYAVEQSALADVLLHGNDGYTWCAGDGCIACDRSLD